jgi:hypothetical protein
VYEVEKGVDLIAAVEEVGVTEFFPERVVAVEIAKPGHVVVVVGGSDFRVT